MAKLYFYYGSMNAGKSTHLLQAAFNYQELKGNPLVFLPDTLTRTGECAVDTRIGLKESAKYFRQDLDLVAYLKEYEATKGKPISCVFVDEAHFLTPAQVWCLSDVVDILNIPVLAYGLRSDFRGELFKGSATLLSIAEVLHEVKNVCFCGKKAIMTMRVDKEGKKITEGTQVLVGGNELYVSVCRKHHKEGISSPVAHR